MNAIWYDPIRSPAACLCLFHQVRVLFCRSSNSLLPEFLIANLQIGHTQMKLADRSGRLFECGLEVADSNFIQPLSIKYPSKAVLDVSVVGSEFQSPLCKSEGLVWMVLCQ